MNSLSSGTYTITCVATGARVGRNPVEDRSLHPKRVMSLNPDNDAPVFELDVQSDGVIIKIGGAHTVNLQNQVMAALMDEPAEKWRITRAEVQGEDTYIIETENRQGGWMLMPNDDEPETSVLVKPLISTKSLPPQYLPHQLWKIVRA